MIEHVRRRALLCDSLSKVYVATCDDQIASKVQSFGGDVILTSPSHKNGTSRVSEAVSNIGCSHVLLLQGDEPLIFLNILHLWLTLWLLHPKSTHGMPLVRLHRLKSLICTRLLSAQLIHEAGSCTVFAALLVTLILIIKNYL